MSFFMMCLLTAEVVSSPVDADLMCVADRHIGCQEVTLVILVMKVTCPDDVTELLRRHLKKTQAGHERVSGFLINKPHIVSRHWVC